MNISVGNSLSTFEFDWVHGYQPVSPNYPRALLRIVVMQTLRRYPLRDITTLSTEESVFFARELNVFSPHKVPAIETLMFTPFKRPIYQILVSKIR